MRSCLYEGVVRHRRFAPRPHEFSYGLYMVHLDLAELDEVFRGRWLWSARRPALAWFRRADHLGDPAQPLDEAVRDLVERETGRRPAGGVSILTHLRCFGYVMNPVSFYWCRGADDEGVEAVVAEVHNTPWGERHCYVLDAREAPALAQREFRFDKAFHVSPFMPMAQEYRWRVSEPGASLAVRMENVEHGAPVFDAHLALRRTEIDGRALARVLVRHPWMTGTVIAAIYWQALRLKLKGTPFHPHPRHRAGAVGGPS